LKDGFVVDDDEEDRKIEESVSYVELEIKFKSWVCK
jgi:hypothetical protein